MNVSKIVDGYEKYIGAPYALIPNPYQDGYESYAEHFEKEYEASHFLIDVDPVRFVIQMFKDVS